MAWSKPSEKHQKPLKRMKASVEAAWVYWRNNYRRYNDYRKFFYKTSLTEDDITLCNELNKPTIQINIGEVNISRLLGEFAKYEPGIEVRPAYDGNADPKAIPIVEGYMRHVLTDAKKKNYQFRIMDDIYSGGWSVAKVRTDYINNNSFHQDILVERVHEPTLTGFDPMAREASKCDGQFCFEYFPMTKEFFKKKYKEVPIDNIQYTQSENGFSWSYKADGNQDVIVVCDYYMKKTKSFTIVELTPTDPTKPGQVMRKKEYEEELLKWDKIEQPPAIVSERITTEDIIMRYRFMEDVVLEVETLDFKHFPLVFIDGNSKLLRETEQGNFEQFTRPYLYHCRDPQRLLNFSVQTLANYLENLVQHKFMVAEESLPSNDDYLMAFENMQVANTFIYKAWKDDSPETPNPAPQTIPLVPAPPEVMATVGMAMNMMQNILGSFDAAQGNNDKRISNDSLITSITQSNAAAQPYIVSYLEGLDHIANMVLYLIPRYILKARVLPVKDKKGNTTQNVVNAKGTPSMNYNDDSLHVSVTAGISFAAQQQQAIQTITELMKVNQEIGEFMGTQGLTFLFDNVEFKGKEQLQEAIKKWADAKQKQQEKAAQQPTPEQMKYQAEMARIAADKEKAEMEYKQHEDQIQQDQLESKVDIMEIQKDLAIAHEKEHSSNVNAHADRILTIHDQKHRHKKEIAEVNIKAKAANKPKPSPKKV